MEKNKLLICIPTYNEESSIGIMIKKIKELNFDFIITDGGSKDNTINIAEKEGIKILHRPGKGKGYGFKLALKYASENGYQYLAVLDGDNTYPIEDFIDYEKTIENHDIIIYCRNYNDIIWHRRLMNYILNFTFNKLYNTNFSDMASGMRVFRTNKFEGLITLDEIYVEVEINILIKKYNLKYVEKKIKYNQRLGNQKSNIFDLFGIYRYIMKNYPLR